jgi:rhodanese-related sulfurtransferase
VADVRPSEAYEEEHIAGALSVPEDDWAARAGDLPRDKLVVAYCA